ncbi:putative ammonium transporter 3 [Ornithodoros turicata]|uniref:putative ammonium transporter 3 n=1 Tax=Ornithodoros turicata TaxID=34597 RepID=UPI003139110E
MLTRDDNFTSDDATWMLTASFVIFTMQTGFGLLEAGTVTKKNEVHILIKNAVNVILVSLSYWSLGYGFQNGKDRGTSPFCGIGSFLMSTPEDSMGRSYATFTFQLSFATAATAIVSGSMAERTNLYTYGIFSTVDTLVYSIAAGWVWGDHGFLKKAGVVDFAGCGCIHLLGGVSSLVISRVIGPRLRRSTARAGRVRMGNPTIAIVGAFTLWWGWLVFNCGSVFGMSNKRWMYAARAAVTALNASIAGGVVGVFFSYIAYKKFYVEELIGSILGALVSVTGSAFYRVWEAVVIGALGAVLVCSVIALMNKLNVDDPLNSVAIHGCGGLWGMIAVGLFVEADKLLKLTNGRMGLFRGGGFNLLCIQLLACVCITAWAVVMTALILKGINLVTPVRIAPEAELLGADFMEYQIRYDGYDYDTVMADLNLDSIRANRRHSAAYEQRDNDSTVTEELPLQSSPEQNDLDFDAEIGIRTFDTCSIL